LFKNQWQLKTAAQEDYARLVEEKYRPIKKKLEEEILRRTCLNRKSSTDISRPKAMATTSSSTNRVGADAPARDPGDVAAAADGTRPEILRFTFPRQREGRKLAIADFFAPSRPARWTSSASPSSPSAPKRLSRRNACLKPANTRAICICTD